ncbi:MAG: zinc-ribbon domain-containing protein [Acutalibacteraceae bacterium]
MFCYKCGTKLADGAQFCHRCGASLSAITIKAGSDIKSETNPKSKQKYAVKNFSINGNKIIFKDGMCEYITVRKPFEQNASTYKERFFENYHTLVKSFEDFLKVPMSQFQGMYTEQIKYAVSVLIKKGIDYVDEDTIRQKVLEYVDIDALLEPYYSGIEEIAEKAECDAQNSKMRQEMRGHRWSGGGFGIKGAIVGSFKAGMMNMGSRALGSVYESLNKVVTDAETESMQKDLMFKKDIDSYLSKALYRICLVVFYVVSDYLCSEGKMTRYYDSYDKEKAKLNNYMDMYLNKQLNEKEFIKKVCECLQKCPYYIKCYEVICILEPRSEPELMSLCRYLGLEKEFELIVQNI